MTASLVLTGPADSAVRFARALAGRGVEAAVRPLLVAGPPADTAGLTAAVGDWQSFDGVVFASARAVAALVGAFAGTGAQPDGRTALAVGRTTAAAATAAGFTVAADGSEVDGSGAAGLLEALAVTGFDPDGLRLLQPRSTRGLDALADGLRARGAVVTVVDAYAVEPVADPAAALADVAGLPVLLASPSAVAALAAAGLDPLPPLLALGATTAAALAEHGLPVAAIAGAADAAAVAAALATLPARAPRPPSEEVPS